ncbi:hypothetical protein JCM14036_21130 [Desulfotomaculum defluvii]
MAEKKSSAIDEQRAADLKVRKQDYMVIGLGLLMILVAKVVA